MPLYFNRRRGIIRARRSNRRRTRRVRTVRQAVAAVRRNRLSTLVRRIANRGVEVKHVGQQVVNAAFNSQISSSAECYRIMPDVTEGTDGHQRIGDKVTTKTLIVKGKLQYDVTMTDNYVPPSTVRVLILTQHDIKSNQYIPNAKVQYLLKDNIGTDTGRAYVGTQWDNLAPINKDLFNVLMDKKIKMREHIVAGLGNTGITSVQGTQVTKTFMVKIKVPKTLYFDDNNGNSPNNFAPFLCLGAVNDDSAGPFQLTSPYRLTVLSELYFVDA